MLGQNSPVGLFVYFMSLSIHWSLFSKCRGKRKSISPLHKRRVRHEGHKYVWHERDFKLGNAANFCVSMLVLVTFVDFGGTHGTYSSGKKIT